ncbi:MAG: methyltransferase domain-containing protein [Anaerolineae bacterium]|nr:methyltransferase domain-containing protein [Anaerolineae bacterium]
MDLSSQLRAGVYKAYSAVAETPHAEHPFAVGREFAERLGYPTELLDQLPSESTEAFTGVSNVSLFASIPAGATVLDVGCGAGLDSLIAAQRAGENGRVIGIDFSEAMLARARTAAMKMKALNVEFRRSSAESLPLEDASIDVAMVNGIFNLNPAREKIFQELARVMKAGGVVYSAEMILREPLPPEELSDDSDWFA